MKQLQKLSAVITGQNLTNKTNYKKTLLLATCLSLLVSSSASCSDNSSNQKERTYSKQEKTLSNTKSVDVGKSFFPIGFYHVSWDTNNEQRMNDLRSIAAAGFNTIHASIKGYNDLDDYGKFLDEADQLGVKVISEFSNEFASDRTTVVSRFKDKPAVLGWNIGDDAGSHASASELLQIHNQIKAADPNHLTYTSVAFDVDMSRVKQSYANYTSVADLIGGQSYPIGLPVTLKNVNDIFSVARTEANKYGHPVIANLQTFRWVDTAWSQLGVEGRRWPSGKEVDNMTYQALLSGVKGIIFYTYYDPANKITEHPEVWNEVQNLAIEIKKLSPVLLNGKRRRINTNVKDLLAGTWTYQGQVYVVAINTSYDSTKTVSIQLPSGIVGKAQPLFASSPSTLSVHGDKLSGVIKPLEVHIYSLDTK